MRISIAKPFLALGLATLLASPVMAQQAPPTSPPPKSEQPKTTPPKAEQPKAEPPKVDPPKTQDPKPADEPKKSPEQMKQEQQKQEEQKQAQDKQNQDQQKKDQPADSKAKLEQKANDAQQRNNNNNQPDVNVNIQQNNQRVLNNIQVFNVTTLPERIRVERIYTIYELRDNSGLVTVEGTMGEKRRIFLNEETFLVTNLRDAADREYPVLLGKESALEKMNLKKGDQLKIEGHDGVVNDKHMLVAFKVTRQGNTVSVRLGPDGVIVHEVAKPISN
jgi:flagellar motor protein MotB